MTTAALDITAPSHIMKYIILGVVKMPDRGSEYD